jgi:hypothetical protein
MTFLPSIIRADYRGGFRIRLTFNDLSEGTVDFRAWLDGPVFEALKKPVYFLAWPNGADIAPETLYEAVVSERARSKRRQQATALPSAKRVGTGAGR